MPSLAHIRLAVVCVLTVAVVGSAAAARDGTLLDAVVVTLGGEELAELVDGNPDIESVLPDVTLEAITYASDDLKVKGYLAFPRQGDHLPCVIVNRGGNREFSAWSDLRAARQLVPLAARGYVVVASQYRGAGGSEGQEEFGGRDVDDVLNLLPLLASLAQADTARIGMIGWSRGGMMTYLALARTDRIRAAVVGGGLSDLVAMAARRPEMADVFAELIPDYATRKDEVLVARSAVRWPEKLAAKTPILILHGAADWRVDPDQALAMGAALLARAHPFRLVVFEGGDHGLSEHRAEVARLEHEWLDRYVRDMAPCPDVRPHGP